MGASRHVLVADDGVDCADTMADLLSICGFELAIARDGTPHSKSRAASTPMLSCWISAWPVDGYEVTRRLLDVVATSGYGQKRDRERSRLAGFDYHLVKPVNHAELLNILSAN